MMTNKTNGKKIPRKFSEKIALLNKKQSESTAEFENIIKEVERSTRPAAPGRHLAGIHKRRNSNVRGLADNLVNSYIDLNEICKQAEYDENQWRQADQYQSSCQLSGTQVVESETSTLVPDITILGIDHHYPSNNCLQAQMPTTETAVFNTTTTSNSNYIAPNDGYLTCNVPYSRANARSLPNIWDGIKGNFTDNNLGIQSPKIGLSPASSMQRLTLDQRYNNAIAGGNNNYLNYQQQVPCNSWNGSGNRLNQHRRPSYSDQVYHQSQYYKYPQAHSLTRAASSNCLRSVVNRHPNQRVQHQDSLCVTSCGDSMSKSIGNNLCGYADDNYQHQPSLCNNSAHCNNSNHHQLQAPSSFTRSHSIGDIGNVYTHQNFCDNSSYNRSDINNNNSNYYPYGSSKQNYYNNQDFSYTTEKYSNNQCYECSTGSCYQAI